MTALEEDRIVEDDSPAAPKNVVVQMSNTDHITSKSTSSFAKQHMDIAQEMKNDKELQQEPTAKYPQPMKFRGPKNERQEAVVKAFHHAWNGYKKYSWGHDHLLPLSQYHQDWFDMGLTLVDSIDTMYIMGLQEEFQEAREWVANGLNVAVNEYVNLFEVIIRVLGGLLSAYHLSGDPLFLTKAEELGQNLMPAFALSGSGIPLSDVNPYSRHARSPSWSTASSTSEVTTIQLELRALSRATGNPLFEKAGMRVSEIVHELPKMSGLVPIFINPKTGKFQPHATITLGARGDSYYEYLLKQWLQTGKSLPMFKDDFIEAFKGIKSFLARRTFVNNLLFIGELKSGQAATFYKKMDHLTCFLPGTLILAVENGLPEYMKSFGEELLKTCYLTYKWNPTFLAPEITHFNFEAFEKYTRVEHGYSSIKDVRNPENPGYKDKMESFFLGETLKYFYLLFSDTPHEFDLTQWVFNTEGHPLPIFDS
ncbi:unnamed protein product [Darwinula stevensoni]|uniref:alpha-1,2-Mannosidase n=1 Tax=Darwinula stevensoni TaxID=69355 RepID=A0A7R8ZZV8_9CRUS|nr:unnamed protein product [Darwinula stevensoni]CAG0879614.1 unnamed protein product [Darwinula stevensoni]